MDAARRCGWKVLQAGGGLPCVSSDCARMLHLLQGKNQPRGSAQDQLLASPSLSGGCSPGAALVTRLVKSMDQFDVGVL